MRVEVPVMPKKAATLSVEVARMPNEAALMLIEAALMLIELGSLPGNAPAIALLRVRLHPDSALIRNHPAFVGIGASAALAWPVLVAPC